MYSTGGIVGKHTSSAVNPRAAEREAKKAAKKEAKLAKFASLAIAKGGAGPLRQLPWPEFAAKLLHRRNVAKRFHIRWCLRTVVRNLEALKEADGRAFGLRPGGRGNIVTAGASGVWTRRPGEAPRFRANTVYSLFENSRYMHELEANLRKLLCPETAIPVVARCIRAKLAVDWEMKHWNLDDDGWTPELERLKEARENFHDRLTSLMSRVENVPENWEYTGEPVPEDAEAQPE